MREEHLRIMEWTKTRADNTQMQAGFASREWASTVGATLACLSDGHALHCLGFDDPSIDLLDAEVVGSCGTYFALLVKAASQRAWTMSSWSELPPHQWASVLHGTQCCSSWASPNAFGCGDCSGCMECCQCQS